MGHGDKGGTHSYVEEYERLLEPYGDAFILMEIGCARGLSLSMWRDWKPKCGIIGMDLSFVFDTTEHKSSGTMLIEADATKPEVVKALEFLFFDVVIDDASHMADDQEKTFRLLKGKMKKGGIYIIEDILCH
jgi:hypothetical protein